MNAARPRARPLLARLAALLLVPFVVSTAAPSARAQTPPQTSSSADGPEAHFKRGVALYQQNDYKAALVEFRRAYELSNNWKLLYNVGEAQYQTHDYPGALASLESYLREGGDRIPRSRRAEIDLEIARLRARVGRLVVRAPLPGATVSIDDEVIGEAPVTRDVAVGSRHVVVTKEGYAPWSRAVDFAGGDTVTLDATLEKVAPPVVGPAPPVPSPEVPQADAHAFPWPAWAVTGALTAAAVTTGIVAISASSSLSAAKDRFDVTDGELHDKATRVTTFSVLTDLLTASAIVSGAFSLYLTLRSRRGTSAAVVAVSPSLGGVVASGRF